MRVGRLLLHVRRRGANRPNGRAHPHVHVGGRGMMQEHPMGWIPRSPVSPYRCSPVANLPCSPSAHIQAMEERALVARWGKGGLRHAVTSVLLVMPPPPHLLSCRRAMETYSPLVLNNPELQLKLALLLTKASHTACWCVPAGVCLLVCAARTREAVHVGGRGAVDYWGPFRTLPNLEAGCLFQVARCHSNC